jgi:hypothetical protein
MPCATAQLCCSSHDQDGDDPRGPGKRCHRCEAEGPRAHEQNHVLGVVIAPAGVLNAAMGRAGGLRAHGRCPYSKCHHGQHRRQLDGRWREPLVGRLKHPLDRPSDMNGFEAILFKGPRRHGSYGRLFGKSPVDQLHGHCQHCLHRAQRQSLP